MFTYNLNNFFYANENKYFSLNPLAINPFSKETPQHHMLEFFLCYARDKIAKSSNNTDKIYIRELDANFFNFSLSQNPIQYQITKYLAKNNQLSFLENFNGWELCDIWRETIWNAFLYKVAIFCEEKFDLCISVAIFWEPGLANLSDKEWLGRLKKSGYSDISIQSLQAVGQAVENFKNQKNLPRMQEIKSKDGNKVVLKGVHEYQNPFIEGITVGGFSWPGYDWVGEAGSRGIYHHAADELSYLVALADQRVPTAIVRRNEFGALSTLAVMNASPRNKILGKCFNDKDFTQILGVEKGQSVSSENKWRSLEHLEQDLSTSYYKTKTFSTRANREIKEKSLTDIIDYSFSILEPVLIKNNIDIKVQNFIKEKSSLVTNKFTSSHVNCRKSKSSRENYRSELKNQLPHFSSTNGQKMEDLLDICEDINNFTDQYSHFDSIIEAQCSFFFKSKSHKSYCKLINPKNKENGFFLKNKKDFMPALNLSEFLYFYLTRAILCNQQYEILDKDSEGSEVKKMFIEYFILWVCSDAGSNKTDITHLIYNLYKENAAYLFSKEVEMRHEYRFFINNHKIVCASPCWRDTHPWVLDSVRKCSTRIVNGHSAKEFIEDTQSRKLVSRYIKWVREFNKSMQIEAPQWGRYSLDVALSVDEDGNECIIPIEINSFGAASPYEADTRKLISSLLGVPFSKDHYPMWQRYRNFIFNEKTHITQGI